MTVWLSFREDLNNTVKDAASLDIFVMTALEERIAQVVSFISTSYEYF